jgi:hypothetical protein
MMTFVIIVATVATTAAVGRKGFQWIAADAAMAKEASLVEPTERSK